MTSTFGVSHSTVFSYPLRALARAAAFLILVARHGNTLGGVEQIATSLLVPIHVAKRKSAQAMDKFA